MGTVPTTSDVLLRGARLVDGDAPVDVLLRGGRVAAVAAVPLGEALEGALEVRLDGRWVMPGLWDAHVHLTQWALARRRLDVSAATSAAHAVALIAAAPP